MSLINAYIHRYTKFYLYTAKFVLMNLRFWQMVTGWQKLTRRDKILVSV